MPPPKKRSRMLKQYSFYKLLFSSLLIFLNTPYMKHDQINIDSTYLVLSQNFVLDSLSRSEKQRLRYFR